MCRCISSRVTAAVSAVIVRLDRTIQYSGTPAMERIGRGVLGPPLSRRTTAVCWAGFCRQGATPTRGQEQKRSASLPLLRHCDFRAFSSKTRAVALSGNEPSMVLAETLRSVAQGSGNGDSQHDVRSSGRGGESHSCPRDSGCAAVHPSRRAASSYLPLSAVWASGLGTQGFVRVSTPPAPR